jgi:GNAT superfamily N-acetyltransferase
VEPPRRILSFQSISVEREPASSLLQAMRDEMAALYDDLDVDAADMPKAGPAELGPPRGDFLVGVDRSGQALCCGGLKALPDGACEFKRLYVRPEVRGHGIAGQLLAALEQRARELGYQVARLDTGPRQPHSRRLFRAAGYRSIPNFNNNPVATFFGEKQL